MRLDRSRQKPGEANGLLPYKEKRNFLIAPLCRMISLVSMTLCDTMDIGPPGSCLSQ
jgi:hypothetical protein